MKTKFFFKTIAACLCACLAAGMLAACTQGEDGGETQPAEYTITAQSGTDYTVSAPDKAKEGDTVTVTVTATGDTYITGVTYNGSACAEEDGTYTFTMPAEDVTIAVQTGTYTAVEKDGWAELGDFNILTVAENGAYAPRVNTEAEHVWKILIDLTGSSSTALRNEETAVTSSNQSVIPDEAITLNALAENDVVSGSQASNLLVAAEVHIDTTRIAEGKTWLTVRLDSVNTSADGTLVLAVNVVKSGEVPVVTEEKTVVIDMGAISDADEGDYFTMRFSDNNYVTGGSVTARYFDVTAQVTDGKLTFSFDYALNHRYHLTLTYGETYDWERPVGLTQTVTSAFNERYDGYTSTGLMFYLRSEVELDARVWNT